MTQSRREGKPSLCSQTARGADLRQDSLAQLFSLGAGAFLAGLGYPDDQHRPPLCIPALPPYLHLSTLSLCMPAEHAGVSTQMHRGNMMPPTWFYLEQEPVMQCSNTSV